MEEEEIKKLKELVCSTIEKNAEKIINFSKSVEKEPELGFKEQKTSKKVKGIFDEIGLKYRDGLALTGVKAKLKDQCEGVNIAVLGELDAVICRGNKNSNPETGAAHTCGHHLQLGALIGAAVGLKLSGISNKLDGNVTFFAVPSEECIEFDYREKLRKQGKLHFFGGKQQLIYEGEFDDVDIAMMMHSLKNSPKPTVSIGKSSNGFVAKTIQYIGKVAHAAEAPDEGVNALNAAMLGLMGVNALRETFRDEDYIRFHPIITKGGDVVNSVPDDVRIESYVRARTIDAMVKTNKKVDRALKAGGDAIGAKTVIKTIPGYLPLECCAKLNDIYKDNCKEFLPEESILDGGHFFASTDMGDISQLIPSIHPYVGGVSGNLHSKEFNVEDYRAACILPAKLFAMTVIDLLVNGAEKGKDIVKNFKPKFSKEEYLKVMDEFNN
ncbi:MULTISPECIES: M20/M25/M40 family metallo-hydrolase [Clostridium]|uniref:Peptidase M20 domain-containing protein 2 n=3 Tax=Clostridium TaxID=1485 RepID=D8GRM5_CLOLD|nr:MULTISPECIES: M20/M25/M40 family metallo-hydrolase [Clostridium]ADK16393.1 putative amidohydrolase [Clostridium ljungdahlii DSM 13528]AGY75471.1 amidohydrolase [Clostridium autoethanogenum DSM 10061]ALU35637.1 Peptidase M20 [Clostridium autoethanogenum DSM 10061]OAA89731.1 putative hydrolase YxeP [Clostridium ljungdahlii DSM 13528]OVY52301.1 putative hydrolase YxeP [Clostridium autoethanogenum]